MALTRSGCLLLQGTRVPWSDRTSQAPVAAPERSAPAG
jgi:hypothetical protein